MSYEELEDAAIAAERARNFEAAVQLYMQAARATDVIQRKVRCQTSALVANMAALRRTVGRAA